MGVDGSMLFLTVGVIILVVSFVSGLAITFNWLDCIIAGIEAGGLIIGDGEGDLILGGKPTFDRA